MAGGDVILQARHRPMTIPDRQESEEPSSPQTVPSPYFDLDMPACVDFLEADQKVSILLDTAKRHRDIATLIETRMVDDIDLTTRRERCERSEVLDFEPSVMAARRAMQHAKPRERWLKSWGAISKLMTDDLTIIIQSIASYCGPFAHPETRLNGLFALFDIFDMIFPYTWLGPMLEEDMNRNTQWDMPVGNAMLDVVEAMTRDERKAIARDERLSLRVKNLGIQCGKHSYELLVKGVKTYFEEVDKDEEKSSNEEMRYDWDDEGEEEEDEEEEEESEEGDKE
ncbi:hypothetical protein BBP40_003425 [Aspergillus hancockii]|nr:hypothetical protein BBP40_003425 [Aspergillus hancockii]